jgi:predicted AAA+ superfamily ATPase
LQIENNGNNMQNHFTRAIQKAFFEQIAAFQVMVILGPKQSGKTTFINTISTDISSIHSYNLKKWDDLQALYAAEQIFKTAEKKIFCLDNIHLAPELLSIIQKLILQKQTVAQFIIVGVMSKEVLWKHLALPEKLVKVFTLCELSVLEMFHPTDFSLIRHWLRGGFPESYFATSDYNSDVWREHYLMQFIANDNVKLGIDLSGMQLYRLLHIFAQNQSHCLNASKIADVFHITHPSIRRYANILEQNFFLRLLPPYPEKTRKRIVKTPKIYIRDSGLLHKLLFIQNMEELRSHPLQLASWKGYVIENVLTVFSDWNSSFYESVSGSCIDLILMKSKKTIAIKAVLTSLDITDNYHSAIQDIHADHAYIVLAASAIQYKEKENVTECNLPNLLESLSNIDGELAEMAV